MARDPDRIEEEIAVTRARIESRLDGLSDQFTPSRVVERALGTGDLNSYDSLEAIVEKARKNPIAASLIGAGLVGLFLAGRRDDEPEAYPQPVVTRAPEGDVEAHGRHPVDPARRVGEHISALGDAVESGRENVSQSARSVSESARETASSIKDSVSGAAEGLSESVSHAAGRAREVARAAPVRARAQTEVAVDWVRENPLPAGLFAVAAGAAISSYFAVRRSNDAPANRYAATRDLYEEARREEEMQAMRRRDAEHLARNAQQTGAAAAKPATKKPTAAAAKKRTGTTSSTGRKSASKKRASEKAAASSMQPSGTSANLVDRDTAVLGEKPKN